MCPWSGRRPPSLSLSLLLICWVGAPLAAQCSSIHRHLGQLLLHSRADPSRSTAKKSGRATQLPAAPPVTIRDDESLPVRLVVSAPPHMTFCMQLGGCYHKLLSRRNVFLQSRSPALPLSHPRIVRRVAGIQPEQVLSVCLQILALRRPHPAPC